MLELETTIKTKRILVDPQLNYLFKFSFELDTAGIDSLTVGMLGYTETGNDLLMRNLLDGSLTNFFLEDYAVNIADQEYTIKAVLFNKDQANDPSSVLNIGTGRNLASVPDLKYVIPYVVVNPASGSIDGIIRNLRFQIASLPYGHNTDQFTSFYRHSYEE